MKNILDKGVRIKLVSIASSFSKQVELRNPQGEFVKTRVVFVPGRTYVVSHKSWEILKNDVIRVRSSNSRLVRSILSLGLDHTVQTDKSTGKSCGCKGKKGAAGKTYIVKKFIQS